MRATDVMTRPVLTVREDDSIEQAAAVLTAGRITSAPVVDAAGDLAGMVSESDLLMGQVPPERVERSQPPSLRGRGHGPVVVADVMTQDVVSFGPNADLAEITEALLYHDVRSVPIVDGAEVLGIVSRRDVLRTIVRADDNAQREVQYRLDEYAGGERRWTATVADGVAMIVGDYADRVEEQVIRALAHTAPGVARVDLRRESGLVF